MRYSFPVLMSLLVASFAAPASLPAQSPPTTMPALDKDRLLKSAAVVVLQVEKFEEHGGNMQKTEFNGRKWVYLALHQAGELSPIIAPNGYKWPFGIGDEGLCYLSISDDQRHFTLAAPGDFLPFPPKATKPDKPKTFGLDPKAAKALDEKYRRDVEAFKQAEAEREHTINAYREQSEKWLAEKVAAEIAALKPVVENDPDWSKPETLKAIATVADSAAIERRTATAGPNTWEMIRKRQKMTVQHAESMLAVLGIKLAKPLLAKDLESLNEINKNIHVRLQRKYPDPSTKPVVATAYDEGAAWSKAADHAGIILSQLRLLGYLVDDKAFTREKRESSAPAIKNAPTRKAFLQEYINDLLNPAP